MDSILTSIKKLLGIAEEYEHFDTDLIIHINSVFMILHQLGVGPKKPFSIKDKSAIWSDFISDVDNIESAKTYVYLKVKSIFDPVQTSSVSDSYDRLIKELEWRLNVAQDHSREEET